MEFDVAQRHVLNAILEHDHACRSFRVSYSRSEGEKEGVRVPSIFLRAVWQASWLANSNGLLHVRTLSHSHFPSMMLQPVTRFSLHGSNPKSWSSSQFSSEKGSERNKYLGRWNLSKPDLYNGTSGDWNIAYSSLHSWKGGNRLNRGHCTLSYSCAPEVMREENSR